MSEMPNHNKSYTADDFRRYAEGRMLPEERHALEKAALEDPFLADALEGWQEATQQFGEAKVESALQELHQHFAEKEKAPKEVPVIPMRTTRWWAVAAAILALVVSSAVIYSVFLKPDTPPNTIAVAPVPEPVKTPESIPPAPPPVSSDTPEKPAAALPAEKKNSTRTSPAPPTTVTQSEPVVVADENKSFKQDIAAAQKRDEATAAPSAVKELTADDAEKKANTVPVLNSFAGKVTDPNNQPIANATVRISNTNNGIVTDANGEFKLKSADSVLPVEVMVIGYASREATLSKDMALNRIQLPPSAAALNEVVVTGKTEAQKKSERSRYLNNLPKVMVQDAEPANGWIEFDKYLQQAHSFSESRKLEPGEVVLSFMVNKSGDLSSFRVEQSLSPEQDAEARRLIEAGPSWRLLKGKKARVTVIIRF